MKIRWNNVIGLPLGIAALSCGLIQGRYIGVFLASLSPGDQNRYPAAQVILGFLALFCLLTGVAVLIKIFLYQRSKP